MTHSKQTNKRRIGNFVDIIERKNIFVLYYYCLIFWKNSYIILCVKLSYLSEIPKFHNFYSNYRQTHLWLILQNRLHFLEIESSNCCYANYRYILTLARRWNIPELEPMWYIIIIRLFITVSCQSIASQATEYMLYMCCIFAIEFGKGVVSNFV